MSGYNFNHFTGKTRGKASRKKKIRMKQNHKDKYEKYSNKIGYRTIPGNAKGKKEYIVEYWEEKEKKIEM